MELHYSDLHVKATADYILATSMHASRNGRLLHDIRNTKEICFQLLVFKIWQQKNKLMPKLA